MTKLDAKSIINYIGNAPKKTPVKVFIKGRLDQIKESTISLKHIPE